MLLELFRFSEGSLWSLKHGESLPIVNSILVFSAMYIVHLSEYHILGKISNLNLLILCGLTLQ